MFEDKVEHTKLTLNLTYPALERLIGGDTEIEVQIKQQIADRFLKNYLKGFINDDKIREVVLDFKRTIDKKLNDFVVTELGEYKYTSYTGRQTLVLKDEYQKVIKQFIKNEVNSLISSTINQIDIKALLEEKMKELVEINMQMINQRVNDMAKKIIDNNVALKMKGLFENG